MFKRSVCEKIKSLGSMLCKYAMQDDLMNKNYALLLELPPTDSNETIPFTDEEIDILFENDSIDDIKVILMMIYCGFRPNEFLSLQRKDIDIEQGFIRGGSKTEAGKNRIVPIHDKVLPYYKYFVDKGNPYLIVTQNNTKYSIGNWRRRHFYRPLEQIGILNGEEDKHVTPYSCRHTFATLCERAGVNENILTKMIGHTTKKTTDKFYIHRTENEMKQAINRIG